MPIASRPAAERPSDQFNPDYRSDTAFLVDGFAEIPISLWRRTPEVRAMLEEFGFEARRVARRGREIIGRVPTGRLADVAAITAIGDISPCRTSAR